MRSLLDLLPLLLLIAGVVNPAVAQSSQKCCNCPIPSVGIFDFAQSIVPPGLESSDRSKLDFRSWDEARQGFLEGYRPEVANDPVCSVHFTSVTLGDKYKEYVQGGFDPDGQAVAGDFDYLLRGAVILGDLGRYNLKVSLIDGTTREQIWEANAGFVSPSEARAAGGTTAQSFAPLFKKICDFWSKKRDEDPVNAVEPKLTLKAAKDKVDVDESTAVDIIAKDCDDSPLKNRKITLSSENGTFTPQTITTDASGKVTAQFKAIKPGIGTLKAVYSYTSIMKHKQKKANGYKTIQIGDPPTGVWRATIDINEEDKYSLDNTRKSSNGTETKSESKSVQRHAMITFLIKGESESGSTSGSEIISRGGYATFDLDHRIHDQNQGDGYSGWGINTFFGSGELGPLDQLVFAFQVSPEEVWVNGTIPIEGKTVDHSHGCATRQSPPCYTQDQTVGETQGIGFGYGNDQIKLKPTPQMIKEGIFRFSLDKTDTRNDPEVNEKETRKRTGTITLEQLKRSQTPASMRSPVKH